MEITVQNSQDIFEKLNQRLWDIPFDNSAFQNEKFIIAAAGTPERAYRSAALRLQDRLEALKAAYFNDRRNAVKLKKLQKQLEAEQDELEKELIQIDIDEMLSSVSYNAKLINDAIVEANQLYQFIETCPQYSREDFEKAEYGYFQNKLALEANGITGALKSLVDMGANVDALKLGRIEFNNLQITNTLGEE